MFAGEWIDLVQPIAVDPLNVGLTHWWLNVRESGWWGGVTFRDLCKRKHGTLSGGTKPVWRGPGGRPGSYGSLEFDGVTSYVSVGKLPGLASATKASASGWILRTATGTTNIFGQSDNAASYRFQAWWATDDNLYISVSNGDNAYWFFNSTNTGWNHILWTYDGSGSAPTLYLNGKAVTLTYGAGTFPSALASTANQGDWEMGRDQNASDTYGGGKIDDVRVWAGRTLTAQEALDVFRDSAGNYARTLSRYLPPAYLSAEQTDTGVTVSPSLQSAAFSLFSATITGGATLAPALQTAAWSTFASAVSTGATLSPSLQTAAWSAFSSTVTGGATDSHALLTAAWSLLGSTIAGGATLEPSLQTAAWSAFGSSVTTGASLAPALQTAAFSLFAPTVTAGDASGVTVDAGLQTAAWSVLTYTIAPQHGLNLGEDDWVFDTSEMDISDDIDYFD